MRRPGRGEACLGLAVCVFLSAWLTIPSHAAKKGDLVVLDHERWIDTLKGTVKNFGKTPARDVTVVVKFLDRKSKVLGTQRVTVGDLRPGDQSSWNLPIAEKHRTATRYQFEVHAIKQ